MELSTHEFSHGGLGVLFNNAVVKPPGVVYFYAGFKVKRRSAEQHMNNLLAQ
jgi:hypothetical protein